MCILYTILHTYTVYVYKSAGYSHKKAHYVLDRQVIYTHVDYVFVAYFCLKKVIKGHVQLRYLEVFFSALLTIITNMLSRVGEIYANKEMQNKSVFHSIYIVLLR